ncbi:hypothetical protein Chor_011659, partial [Crotalus horridus]
EEKEDDGPQRRPKLHSFSPDEDNVDAATFVADPQRAGLAVEEANICMRRSSPVLWEFKRGGEESRGKSICFSEGIGPLTSSTMTQLFLLSIVLISVGTNVQYCLTCDKRRGASYSSDFHSQSPAIYHEYSFVFLTFLDETSGMFARDSLKPPQRIGVEEKEDDGPQRRPKLHSFSPDEDNVDAATFVADPQRAGLAVEEANICMRRSSPVLWEFKRGGEESRGKSICFSEGIGPLTSSTMTQLFLLSIVLISVGKRNRFGRRHHPFYN